jgi:peptide-methionine (S)-S-oxide reductase
MKEVATLGGGCFWCLEAVYQLVEGVESVVSGYAGGSVENPTYKQVCSGLTGHAEVVQVIFENSKISYKDILNVFWQIHDPTTLNRQGADEGTQYRSIILYHSEQQKQEAEISLQNEQKNWSSPIVTEIKPLDKFYPAEEYHQNYYNKNPNASYCYFVIRPKVEKWKMKSQSK